MDLNPHFIHNRVSRTSSIPMSLFPNNSVAGQSTHQILHQRHHSSPANMDWKVSGDLQRRADTYGLDQWAGSEKFSDITIRYGYNNELVFHGHKIVLSSVSIWFQRGFLGIFVESESEEICLVGDDPNALYTMLTWSYNPTVKHSPKPESWTDGELEQYKATNKVVMYHISVYQVADKYVVKDLTGHAALSVRHAMADFLRLAPQDQIALQLRQIIDEVYARVVPKGDLLAYNVIEAIFEDKETMPIGRPGRLAFVVNDLVRAVPEFGADMFLRLAQKTQGPFDTQWVPCVTVHCPGCNQESQRPMDETDGCCMVCGSHDDDWTMHIQP